MTIVARVFQEAKLLSVHPRILLSLLKKILSPAMFVSMGQPQAKPIYPALPVNASASVILELMQLLKVSGIMAASI